ncbi:MAG: PqqD family protein [Alphaproteobacteria bacterium]|nr:PqqD family protein [Alphaproteobacteria bacterium]
MNCYRRCPGINETPVEDELFLIAGDSGDIFHLDRLAMSLWRALEAPAGEAELLVLFGAAFPETPADTIERDLQGALATLLDGELIEVCD